MDTGIGKWTICEVVDGKRVIKMIRMVKMIKMIKMTKMVELRVQRSRIPTWT